MKTVKYYTDSGIYKGWQKARHSIWMDVIHWIRSGNSVEILGVRYFETGSVKHALMHAVRLDKEAV